jgi:hypothetical protein
MQAKSSWPFTVMPVIAMKRMHEAKQEVISFYPTMTNSPQTTAQYYQMPP